MKGNTDNIKNSSKKNHDEKPEGVTSECPNTQEIEKIRTKDYVSINKKIDVEIDSLKSKIDKLKSAPDSSSEKKVIELEESIAQYEKNKNDLMISLFASADIAYIRALDAYDELKRSVKNRAAATKKETEKRTIASNDYVTRSAYYNTANDNKKLSKKNQFKIVDRKESVEFWLENTDEYKITKSPFDGGVPGSYYVGHAEKQQAFLHHSDNMHTPIGITKEQCGNCRIAMRDYAKKNSMTLVAKDPRFYRIYNGDGSVEIFEYENHGGKSLIIDNKIVGPNEKPKAGIKPSTYMGVPW